MRNDEFQETRKYIINQLLGVDVYYENPKSQTNFCFCQASYFPFRVVLDYDDVEDVIKLDNLDDFKKLVKINK